MSDNRKRYAAIKRGLEQLYGAKGVTAQRLEWDIIIQRPDRCDLSFFQLG